MREAVRARLAPVVTTVASAPTRVFALTLLFAASCKDSPSEPEPKKPPPVAETSQDTPREGDMKVTTDAPLHWEAPAGFTLTESSDSTARRAGYSVPRVGEDKEDGELLVLYFGRGKESERDAQWSSWFSQFDGDAKRDAKRDAFKVGDLEVETFEFLGSYKLNVGPHRKRATRSPVQMVKKDFRMVGAFVKSPKKGNWFFRLVGPDQTVLAAKDAFLQMIKSAN